MALYFFNNINCQCCSEREGFLDILTDHFITGDPAFAIDEHGFIVLWNEAAEEALGFSANEAIGKKCWDLLSGQDSNGNRYCCVHCPLREMASRHEPVNSFHSTFMTSSDQPKHFDVSCLTVINDAGGEMLLHICRPEDHLPELSKQRESSDPPANPALGSLSQREIEILTLLAEQVSTADIAVKTSISVRTVRTHIQHLMYKLQVHNRHDAIEAGKCLKLI